MTNQKQYIAAIHCGTGAEGLRVRQELQDWAERQGMSLSGLVKALAEKDVRVRLPTTACENMLILVTCPDCGHEQYFEYDSLPGGDEHCEYCEVCCTRISAQE